MSYIKLRFGVHRDRADVLNALLEEMGALAVSWENAGDDEYLETAYPREPDWRNVYLTGLFDSSCRPEEVVGQVSEHLQEDLAPRIETVDDRDWERAWLERFKPRKYRGNLWVCPTWINPPDPGATTIVLDPGLAFGTGEHATTTLCLDWISVQDLAQRTVMDYGCGSGILAIACLLRGGAHAVGVDIDPRAISASRGNAELNGVSEKYDARSPEELPRAFQADVVIANILAQVLIDQSDVLIRATRNGGRILLTGILEDQVVRIRAKFDSYFRFEVLARDQWRLLVGHKAKGRSVSLPQISAAGAISE